MNWSTGKILHDTLHSISNVKALNCRPTICTANHMNTIKEVKPIRTGDAVLDDAKKFIDEFYASIEKLGSAEHLNRWSKIKTQIEETNGYIMKTEELKYGATVALGNTPLCPGRIQWEELQVFDSQHVATAQGMFEAICTHLQYATNGGNLRPAITSFPPRQKGRCDFRVWNYTIIGYACYKQSDGTLLGDPFNLELTQAAQKLGWAGKGTREDILPLIVEAGDGEAHFFDIPEDLVLQVPLRHPKYEKFSDLRYKWFALPGVSCLKLDCGGLEFSAIPFSGWYSGSEKRSRDLGDEHRFNPATDMLTRSLSEIEMETLRCARCKKIYKYRRFYEIHQRLCLEKVIKCSLCKKEFLRKANLKKHLRSHMKMAALSTVEKNKKKPLKRKLRWFEEFCWFISSNGYLIIGCKDITQNHLLFNEFLEPGDCWFYADINGARWMMVKNPTGEAIPDLTIQEVTLMTICFSDAWRDKNNVSCWWIHGYQLNPFYQCASRKDEIYGGFIIKGQKYYITPPPLEIGFGIIFGERNSIFERPLQAILIEGCFLNQIRCNMAMGGTLKEEELVLAVPMIGPYSAVSSLKYKAHITPGNKMKKGATLCTLQKFIDKSSSEKEKELIRKINEDLDLPENVTISVRVD